MKRTLPCLNPFAHKTPTSPTTSQQTRNLYHTEPTATSTVPLHNAALWRTEVPEQAVQIVESQQVFKVAKENVSASSAIEMSKTDMSSTTANAATSQFLKLLPEIRCRIYDYVFGSNLVRIGPCLHTGTSLKSPSTDDAEIFEEVLKRIESDLIGSCLRENA